MQKRVLGILSLLVLISISSFSCGENSSKDSSQRKYTIASVGKIEGISWFIRMREGVEKFKNDTGHDAFMLSPAQADAAQQVQIVENLIAQGVDAICIVPFSPEAVEPVLKKARDNGIKVIVHEASQQQNADIIIEAFSNYDFGQKMAQYLVNIMGDKGEVANFVGSLTSKSHNEQQDGVEAFLKNYPNIKLVSRRNEDYDDSTKAYEKTKELLTTFPNLTGIIGSASTTVPGASLAIDERRLQDKVTIVGVATPLDAKQYLDSGAADIIALWDPAVSAYAMNLIAVKLLNGETIEDGADLGLEGYNKLRKDANDPKLFFGEAGLFLNKDNASGYDF